MKSKFLLIILLFVCFFANAQAIDTTVIARSQKPLTYKHFIIPAFFIGGGFALSNTQSDLKLQNSIRKIFGTDYHTNIDDYLRREAILQIYGGRYLGFKPKNDFLHQTINILIANSIMGITVGTIKHTVKKERPDLSDCYSFPSGHTATAFTNASLLFYEYKESNIWYASSGFLFATATGILRIANNKHYVSDVLTGTGIGLTVGTIVSYWNPFKSLTLGKNKAHAILYPQIGKEYGIGLVIVN